jgi:hypothetical protein
MQLLNKWNEGLNKQVKEFNNEFEKYDIKDKGGLIKSYRFTTDKRRNLLRKELRKRVSPLEQRLRAR